MDQEWEVEWEDGTVWSLSWFRDAGCFFADRWFPEGDDEEADGPFVDTPGPELVMVEDLETLEAVMGRPIPGNVRDQLESVSEAYPFTPEMRAAWRVESAFGITRMHPSGEWIETFAPPGHPSPFDIEWLPEWMA